MEKIVAAAFIPEGTETVHTGHNYSEIIVEIVRDKEIKPPIRGDYGFITEKGEFVDPLTAADIAVRSGQVKKLTHPPSLFTKDINFSDIQF